MLVRTRRRLSKLVPRRLTGAARRSKTPEKPDDWVLKLATAIFLIFLSGVGTVGYRCAVYIFVTAPELAGHTEPERLREMKRRLTLMEQWTKFTQSANNSIASLSSQLLYLQKIVRDGSLQAGGSDLGEVNDHSLSNMLSISLSLGEAQGYPVDELFLTAPYKSAIVGLLSSDLEMWEAIYRCTDPGISRERFHACRIRIVEAEMDVRRAAATASVEIQVGTAQAKSRAEQVKAEGKESLVATRGDLRHMYLAFAGVVAWILIYYLAFRFLLLGPVSQAIEAKLQEHAGNRVPRS